MRYASGLLLIGFSLVFIAISFGSPLDDQLGMLIMAGATMLQGVFALLPSSLLSSSAPKSAARWRKLWACGVITHTLWGLFLLFVGLAQFTEPEGLTSGLILTFLLALPILGGALQLHLIRRRASSTSTQGADKTSADAQEIQLIQAAARLNGECTLLELVAHSAINRERVEQLLDSLAREDLVSIYVDEYGQTFYRFSQLFEAPYPRRDILDDEPVLFDHEEQEQHTSAQQHSSKR